MSDEVKQLVPPNKIEAEKTYRFYDVTYLKVRKTEQQSHVGTSATAGEEEKKKESAKEEEENEATISTKYSTKRVKGGGVTRKIIQKIRKEKSTAAAEEKKLSHRERIGLKSKYEMSIVYEKPTGKLGVRKLFFGKHGEPSLESMPEVGDTMRDEFCRLLLDHPRFDRETYIKYGRFFNKKFWHLNLCWNRQLAALGADEVIFNLCEQVRVLEEKLNTA